MARLASSGSAFEPFPSLWFAAAPQVSEKVRCIADSVISGSSIKRLVVSISSTRDRSVDDC